MNNRIFEQQVDRYRDRVYGLACYLVGVNVDAEDITQEVFLRLWQRRKEIDKERVLGWLLRVTRNCCIDLHRKKKARFLNLNPIEFTEDTGVSDDRGPDKQMDDKRFANILKDAISNLPDPYRSILVLREMHEMKYDEIADVLDLPLTTVKVYLHRARAKLRKDLIERDVLELGLFESKV